MLRQCIDTCMFLLIHALMVLMIPAIGGCAAPQHAEAAKTAQIKPSPLERFEFNRLAMGVQARVVLYGCDRTAAQSAAAAAFAEIARLEQIMSDYRHDSELMQVCRAAGGVPVAVSEDLFQILEVALEISAKTGGALDVTVGPLSQLWRSARRTGRWPDPHAIDAALAFVNWHYVSLRSHDRTVQLAKPGISLDLGGMAKGYAADRARQMLRERGFAQCLVALDGDIAVGDPPPGRDGWAIEIATRLDASRFPNRVLLANACISTSGSDEQFLDVDGVRYSHIIDPRTGKGVTHTMQVTVMALDPQRGELADGLASAVSVLGILGFAPPTCMAYEFQGVAVITEIAHASEIERSITDPAGIVRWQPVEHR